MPYYNRDPERGHNFDNHPYHDTLRGAVIVREGWRVHRAHEHPGPYSNLNSGRFGDPISKRA